MNSEPFDSSAPNYGRAIMGLIGGGALGCIGFYLMRHLGLYAMIVPGAMIGLGCGAQAGGRSIALGVVAAVVSLALGIVIEWYFFPFIADKSLSYFLQNLSGLTLRAKIMIAAGAFAGFWFGRGR